MRFLVFNSQGQANAAQNKIWAILEPAYIKRGYVKNDQGVRDETGETVRWSVPRERLDGKWVMPHPEKSILRSDMKDGQTIEARCMNKMAFRNIEDFSPDWFVVET